jgi:hypothetical protein
MRGETIILSQSTTTHNDLIELENAIVRIGDGRVFVGYGTVTLL